MLSLIPNCALPKTGPQPLPALVCLGMSSGEKKQASTGSLHIHMYLNNLLLLEGGQNAVGVRLGIEIRVEISTIRAEPEH